MALGTLETEAQLEQFVRGVLDRVGLGRADSGVADKSVAKGKLATDALNAFLKVMGLDLAAAVGSDTVVFTASTVSATRTITHGLKDNAGANKAPLYVLALPFNALGFQLDCNSKTATTIGMQASTGSAVTTTVNFDWLAIG